jgi:hypothetical protein
MTHAASPNLGSLTNSSGTAVGAAEDALTEARRALDSHGSPAVALLRAARALAQAGWIPAQRFADTLVLASPLAQGELAVPFGAAVDDFRAVLARRDLRKLACSTTLFEHYRRLNAHIAAHTGAFGVAYEDLALAGRPIPPATMRPLRSGPLGRLRACYEGALLALMRGEPHAEAPLAELEGCLAELVGSDPYDVWRLASACGRELRSARVEAANRAGDGAESQAHCRTQTGDAKEPPGGASSAAPRGDSRWACGEASTAIEIKRFYARCNLLLADQLRGTTRAPRSFVRAALALLWRGYVLDGAAAGHPEHVELLSDYGLTVDEGFPAAFASGTVPDTDVANVEPPCAPDGAARRELGVLSIDARTYEQFLLTAESAMVTLAASLDSMKRGAFGDAAQARRFADAAYALGTAACAGGLGHIATLADALGVAWRLTGHAQTAAARIGTQEGIKEGMQEAGQRTSHDRPSERAPQSALERAPSPTVIAAATESLRAMLLRVAAGVAPPASAAPLAALARAIEGAPPSRLGAAADRS